MILFILGVFTGALLMFLWTAHELQPVIRIREEILERQRRRRLPEYESEL